MIQITQLLTTVKLLPTVKFSATMQLPAARKPKVRLPPIKRLARKTPPPRAARKTPLKAPQKPPQKTAKTRNRPAKMLLMYKAQTLADRMQIHSMQAHRVRQLRGMPGGSAPYGQYTPPPPRQPYGVPPYGQGYGAPYGQYGNRPYNGYYHTPPVPPVYGCGRGQGQPYGGQNGQHPQGQGYGVPYGQPPLIPIIKMPQTEQILPLPQRTDRNLKKSV